MRVSSRLPSQAEATRTADAAFMAPGHASSASLSKASSCVAPARSVTITPSAFHKKMQRCLAPHCYQNNNKLNDHGKLRQLHYSWNSFDVGGKLIVLGRVQHTQVGSAFVFAVQQVIVIVSRSSN